MTTQHEIAKQRALPIHPPKVEIFDLEAGTNTDPKQRVRDVDTYQLEPFGLYLARPFPGHPTLTYLESWLLPELGLRITRWERIPGHEAGHDYYLDIVGITTGTRRWTSVDHYLDITITDGSHAELLDIDEFVAAVRADLLDSTTAHRAMEIAWRAMTELADYRYSLPKWLYAKEIELSWSRQTI